MRFSVIIPTYQAAATIGGAVHSAIGQTHPDLEVIVVDDGSTDDTDAALAPFRSSITYLRQENSGPLVAANRGLEIATGEFIVRLDADDSWLPNRLEAMETLLRQRAHLDILTTDAFVRQPDGSEDTHYESPFPSEERQPVAILERNFIFGQAAVRRSILSENGGFDVEFTKGSEYATWVRLILAGSRAGLVPKPLALYNRHAGSYSTDRIAEHLTMTLIMTGVVGGRYGPLSAEQRRAAILRRKEARGLLDVARAVDWLGGGERGSRINLLRSAGSPHLPTSTRMKFIAAWMVPTIARRRNWASIRAARADAELRER